MRLHVNVWLIAEVLFACNAYHIGKERCYFKGALACGYRVWVSPRRRKTLSRLGLPKEWLALLTDNVAKCDVIISDQGVSPPKLQALREEHKRPVVGFQCTGAHRCRLWDCGRGMGLFARVVANDASAALDQLRPLLCLPGWSFQKNGTKKREQDGTVSYGIPYSEHSSWDDLRACVRTFRPKQLVRALRTTIPGRGLPGLFRGRVENLIVCRSALTCRYVYRSRSTDFAVRPVPSPRTDRS